MSDNHHNANDYHTSKNSRIKDTKY